MKKYVVLLIVALGSYVVTAPIWPNVTFFLDNDNSLREAVYSDEIIGDYLLIPSINLLESVYEGEDESVLSKGIWYLPWSDSSNSILTAHRFTYLPPYIQPFYHLDKVSVGDWIYFIYEDIEYSYVVESITTVESNELRVEEGGEVDKITLYTCTPLWTADKRLVIVGKLMRQEQLSGILMSYRFNFEH